MTRLKEKFFEDITDHKALDMELLCLFVKDFVVDKLAANEWPLLKDLEYPEIESYQPV